VDMVPYYYTHTHTHMHTYAILVRSMYSRDGTLFWSRLLVTDLLFPLPDRLVFQPAVAVTLNPGRARSCRPLASCRVGPRAAISLDSRLNGEHGDMVCLSVFLTDCVAMPSRLFLTSAFPLPQAGLSLSPPSEQSCSLS
jgi:hypothetical protein